MPITSSQLGRELGASARDNGRAKGIETQRRRKHIAEAINAWLAYECADGLTGAQKMAAVIIDEALKRNLKAWELLRDTVGEKPKERTENYSRVENENIVIDFGQLDGN